jgi:pimeloyl-ACP methyl ester carboxylesterase
MSERTVPYDPTRDALNHPHLATGFFPVTIDLPDDLLCAECSLLAYKKFESDAAERSAAETALASAGFEDLLTFNRGGSQAFAAWHPKTGRAVVAIRGTEPDDRTDLPTDVEALLEPWPQGGRAHAGFQEGLDLLWQDVERWLEAHPGRWLFTGHSLGAALSTLAASLLPPAKLVTFGSPRVGDPTFVETLSGIEVARYVDCCDVVTRLPPPAVPFDYLHVNEANPLYIDRLGEIVPGATESGISDDRRIARREYIAKYAWKRGTVAVRDLADHAPINYVYALRHWAARQDTRTVGGRPSE